MFITRIGKPEDPSRESEQGENIFNILSIFIKAKSRHTSTRKHCSTWNLSNGQLDKTQGGETPGSFGQSTLLRVREDARLGESIVGTIDDDDDDQKSPLYCNTLESNINTKKKVGDGMKELKTEWNGRVRSFTEVTIYDAFVQSAALDMREARDECFVQDDDDTEREN